jgi:L-malate glycosyltransferase
MAPIRVCYLIDRLSVGGTETQLLALMRSLDRQRVTPFLCLLDGETEESRTLEPDDCPVLRLGIRALHHPSTFRKAVRLVRFLRGERVDVLQVYFQDSMYLGLVAGRCAGVPRILRTRNNTGYFLTPFQRQLSRLCNFFSDGAIANCEISRQILVDQEGARPESTIVVENGIDLSRFLTIPPVDGRQPLRRIGMVANLRPVKQPQLLVEAAAMLRQDYPDLQFTIAGEGPLRPELERRIAELGLADAFHLLGSVADIPAFLASVDIGVLTSQTEGMSNSVLEYMAAARAIVATAVGGNIELIKHGEHGLLVGEHDPAALAGALGQFLQEPPLAARLGACARARAAGYGQDARARRFESLYQELLTSHKNAVGNGCRRDTVLNRQACIRVG